MCAAAASLQAAYPRHLWGAQPSRHAGNHRGHMWRHLLCGGHRGKLRARVGIEPFDLYFDLHLFLQKATVIGYNKSRDLIYLIAVAACKINEDRTTSLNAMFSNSLIYEKYQFAL